MAARPACFSAALGSLPSHPIGHPQNSFRKFQADVKTLARGRTIFIHHAPHCLWLVAQPEKAGCRTGPGWIPRKLVRPWKKAKARGARSQNLLFESLVPLFGRFQQAVEFRFRAQIH